MKKELSGGVSRFAKNLSRIYCCVILFSFLIIALFPKLSPALSAVSFDNVKSSIAKGSLLVDVRGEDVYGENHLIGAVNVPFFELMDDTQHLYPSDEMAEILGDYGVGREGTTIVYAHRGSMQASYMGWILEYLGAENVLVYMGGIEDWTEKGGGLDSEEVEAEPADFEPVLRENMRVDAEFLKENVGKGKIVVVDARSDGEFFGQDIRAIRGGHIPGAINIDWVACLNPKTKDLAPLKRLKHVFSQIPKDKPITVYCQTGARASMALLAMKEVGFKDVSLYPESWKDWGSNLGLPVENETFYDFFALKMNLNQLQSKDKLLKSEQETVATTANTNTILLVFACILGYAGMVILITRKDNEMKTSIWAFIVTITVFAGFLIGYTLSAHTGIYETGTGQEKVGAGGYGK